MIIVGSPAPVFTADAIVNGQIGTVSLKQFLGKFVLLFFYPGDFSHACPSELQGLQRHLADFQARDVEILAVSVDSHYTHQAWLQMPVTKGGVEGSTITLISDMNQRIARAYGVLNESTGTALRASFVIDRAGITQYGSANLERFARSIDELLRVVDAIQYSEKHGVHCLVNWRPGDSQTPPRSA